MPDITKKLFRLGKYHDLLWQLVRRSLQSRYRGSVLGFLWSFLNPLILMLVYYLIFSVYMRIRMDNYAVFMFCGLLPWIWFSSSAIEGTMSLISNANLIKKVLFPSEIFPLVTVIANLINYLLSLPILILFVFISKMEFSPALMFWFIPLVLIQTIFTSGFVFATSALTVHFKDIQHILLNILTLWFFMCPIIYPITQVPLKFRFTITCNPVGLLVMCYQDIFFFKKTPAINHLLALTAVSLIIFLLGYKIFDNYRYTFAEEL